jgi:hypothetical protein
MLKSTIKYLRRSKKRQAQIRSIHVEKKCGQGNNNSMVSTYYSKGLASREPWLFN